MNGAINLQRLAQMKAAMAPAAPQLPSAPDPAAAPVPPAPPAAPEAPPPPPGAPVMDATAVPPASQAADPDAAADAASAASTAPDDDPALTASAQSLLAAISGAENPASAQKILMDFIKAHGEGARNAALQQLPKIAENMQAAADEWKASAEKMLGANEHLRGQGQLLELLTKDEYGKDPKRTPDAIYAEVAKRANGMLQSGKAGPSLPETAQGPTPSISTPAPETRNDIRLRQLRAGRK